MPDYYHISGKLMGSNSNGAPMYPLSGTFLIADAVGVVLAGPSEVEADGSFYVTGAPGQQLVLSMRGYTDKILNFGTQDVDDITVALIPVSPDYWPLALVLAAVALYRYSQKKKGRKKIGAFTKNDLIPLFWLAGGLIAFSVLKKILISLHIWEDPKSQALDQAAIDPSSPWRPDYWRKSQNYSYAIDTATAQAYAKEIYDAFGYFDDNEDQAIGVFRRLRTKANLSFLADIFNQLYGQDLLTFLRGGIWPKDRLSDDDVSQINSMIAALPNY